VSGWCGGGGGEGCHRRYGLLSWAPCIHLKPAHPPPTLLVPPFFQFGRAMLTMEWTCLMQHNQQFA
jgi:hypothetical protein